MSDPNTAPSKSDAGTDGRSARFRVGGRAQAIAVALVLVLAVGIALYLHFGRPETPPPPPGGTSDAALTVARTTPLRVIWPNEIAAQGAIAAWQEASIGTQIGSYQLIAVRVNVGDQVRRGQVLARLDPALLRAEEAQLLARHAQADANDRRARALQGVGGISEQEALQFATEARAAAALLAAKRLELRYTHIRAPDDGVISARSATLGAVVSAGQELFRMIRQNRLEWRGELTPEDLATARRGQMVTLALPDGSRARARIREFAPALDGGSRLAIVYADVLPGSAARAGMYVRGLVATGESPALVVPAECVVLRDGRTYVLHVPGEGRRTRAVLRGVTTGRRRAGQIEIIRGLTGAERLVRRGAAFLEDGDLVEVANGGKARP